MKYFFCLLSEGKREEKTKKGKNSDTIQEYQ